MHGKRLDQTAKALVGSRRAALTRGVALVLGGMLTAFSPRAADARTRRLKPAYTCPPPSETTMTLGPNGRLAQSFTASRSGTLRQIKVAISKDGSVGDYVVQVVKMAGDLSSNSPLDVLAAATVPDAQVKSGDVTLVANFATTRLTQSTVYAVVVSRTTATTITGRALQGGDDCTGDLYIGDVREGFLKPLDPVMDMIVTVLVL